MLFRQTPFYQRFRSIFTFSQRYAFEIRDEFINEKGISSRIDVRVMDLISEAGELSKEVLTGSDYGRKSFSATKGWKNELGDVLFALICIANVTSIDLEICLKKTLEKLEQRFTAKGDLSSGR